MIHVFTGTKAQLIKMAPVMVEMRRRGVPFRQVDSGQHASVTASLRKGLGIGPPDVSLRAGSDVTTVRQAVAWYVSQWSRGLLWRGRLRRELFPEGGVCLIHGDTLSTLLGMQMARRAGLDVAHVEAGLRSFRILEPFPEELVRILCMRRAQLLFAPSREAADNLATMHVKGRIVEVAGNTVIDALRLAGDVPVDVSLPDGPFALATCHRVENITRRARLRKIVSLLGRAAESVRVVWVVHAPTARYLEKFRLAGRLHPDIERRGPTEYPAFVRLLKAAQFVLTDGGSIQEECACLNKPCLVLRRATERPDGIGTSAELWNFDEEVARRFLSRATAAAPAEPDETAQPSKQIVDELVRSGYASG